ncbi:MAG: DUF411 domain-containing protein [Xenococcaceae cyanobacterium MO_188.B32]|nr:DUF411 domain-containing protein [Xenococcaceae cyanobacterium MO_188.B32]
MPKLLSKITITSIAIAAVIGGGIYFNSTSRVNKTVSQNNSAVVNENPDRATLVSVWDKEIEPAYSGITEMTVYRSPSCGCCGVWVEHAQKHGFKIKDIKTEEMEALKQKYNIPTELASCHTAIIDGYVMEGHIPADDIKRFLQEKPQIVGLAVPGMPIGTPGMEARDIKQPFQVLAFNNEGQVEVFREYESY